MLKDIITADQLSLVISQAAAPAFLLGESPTPGTAVASSPGHPGDLLGGRMRNHDLRPHDRCLCLNLCRRAT